MERPKFANLRWTAFDWSENDHKRQLQRQRQERERGNDRSLEFDFNVSLIFFFYRRNISSVKICNQTWNPQIGYPKHSIIAECSLELTNKQCYDSLETCHNKIEYPQILPSPLTLPNAVTISCYFSKNFRSNLFVTAGGNLVDLILKSNSTILEGKILNSFYWN